jgi:ribosome-binding protein aMBF1 (putative translation factor)
MAGKRTKVTEEEQFYIQLNPKGLSQQELADKFDASLKVVTKIQADHKEAEEKKAEILKVNAPKEPTLTRKLMTGKSEGKGNKVSIMTEAASERLDGDRAAMGDLKKKNKYANNFTTKSFPEE